MEGEKVDVLYLRPDLASSAAIASGTRFSVKLKSSAPFM
jgi:hypothetical protein